MYFTGGAIALLTLVESHYKNEDERNNYYNQNKNTLDSLDITRQQISLAEESLKSEIINQKETRTREKLSDGLSKFGSESPIEKIGGITQLASMADEFLESNKKDEAQEIITILCSYLKLPPPSSELNGGIESEAIVRRTIIETIKIRLQRDSPKWDKNLVFDFSNSEFFYDINLKSISALKSRFIFENCIFKKGLNLENSTFNQYLAFNSSKFYGTSRFTNGIFNSISFRETYHFESLVLNKIEVKDLLLLRDATIRKTLYSVNSEYSGKFDSTKCNSNKYVFTESKFLGLSFFNNVKTGTTAHFRKCKFKSHCDFSHFKFKGEQPDFSNSVFIPDGRNSKPIFDTKGNIYLNPEGLPLNSRWGNSNNL